MLFWILALAALALAALWLFAPREPVETAVTFDETPLAGGIDAYLATQEARFDDIRPGVAKRVIWAKAPEEKTALALVYIHGFSATLQEVRPLPDKVAQALGANLVYTRLQGHGRTGEAMAQATVQGWMQDVAEALAIGHRIGEQVIVMGTSTGATLITLALHEDMGKAVKGAVFIAPNFKVRARSSVILTWPLVRHWAPLVAGPERSFEPQSPDHANFWTSRYPTVALLPMAASVKAVNQLPLEAVKTPALFVFSDDDQVVDHSATRRVAARWGGPAQVEPVTPGPGDDPSQHVIAGDIMSPGMTDPLAARITTWIKELN